MRIIQSILMYRVLRARWQAGFYTFAALTDVDYIPPVA